MKTSHCHPASRYRKIAVCRAVAAGFTLVEMLIVVGALGLVTAAVMLMFTSSHQTMVSNDAYLHVQQEARRALDAMDRELRKADHIDTDVTSQGQDATNAARLNFQVARGYNVAGCTPNDICWGNDSSNNGWVHYLRNGTQLVRCESSAPDTVISDFSGCRVLANDAQSFLVSYAGSSKTVTLDLQVQYNSAMLPNGATGTGTLRTQVRLRNP